jgi:hypothetical protein
MYGAWDQFAHPLAHAFCLVFALQQFGYSAGRERVA